MAFSLKDKVKSKINNGLDVVLRRLSARIRVWTENRRTKMNIIYKTMNYLSIFVCKQLSANRKWFLALNQKNSELWIGQKMIKNSDLTTLVDIERYIPFIKQSIVKILAISFVYEIVP